MILIESHQIRPDDERFDELSDVLRRSSNLRNSALYQWRQAFFLRLPLPEFGDICYMFALSDQKDYRSLPAKVAQATVKSVFKEIESFFALLHSDYADDHRIGVPDYKPRGRRYVATYTSQAISKTELVEDGVVRLSGTEVRVKTRQAPESIRQVRVVPHNGYIAVEVAYEVEDVPMMEDNGRYASLDPGVNNLATVAFNTGRGFIIRGGPMKSIIQYRCKREAQLVSKLEDLKERELLKTGGVHGKKAVEEFRKQREEERQKALRALAECRRAEEEGLDEREVKELRRERKRMSRKAKRVARRQARMRAAKKAKKFSSKRLESLRRKSWNKLMDYMHKSSSELVNRLVSNNTSTLFIGKNKGWTQEVNLGRVVNQMFVAMPIAVFLEMVAYKCRKCGIRVVYVQESYTSKCSFLDGESICHHDRYLGKRVKRGLFRSADGTLINADLNGALNIMRKAIGDFDYPIEVCSAPVVLTIKV